MSVLCKRGREEITKPAVLVIHQKPIVSRIPEQSILQKSKNVWDDIQVPQNAVKFSCELPRLQLKKKHTTRPDERINKAWKDARGKEEIKVAKEKQEQQARAREEEIIRSKEEEEIKQQQARAKEKKEIMQAKDIMKRVAQETEEKLTQDWLELCRPKKINEVIGRDVEIMAIGSWLKMFNDNNLPLDKPICLLIGPPGVGKTTLAHVMLQEHEYQVVEINASETRGYNETLKLLQRTCLKKTIGGKSALVFDEIDGAFEGGKNSVTAIIDFLTENKAVAKKAPIICICNSIYSGGVRKMLKYCKQIKFLPFTKESMQCIVQGASRRMDVQVPVEKLNDMIRTSDGDSRQLIMSTRFSNSGTKDEHINMFESTKRFFTPQCDKDKLSMAIDVLRGTGHMAGGLISENYLSHANSKSLESMESVSEFADAISEYDIMNNWQYKEHTDDGGIAHTFLSKAAQKFVSLHPSNQPIHACKRVFYNNPGPNVSIIEDENHMPQYVRKDEKYLLDIIMA
jgi:DNA polymerase III delta prime subunit